jgi:hypothetical protein
LPADGGGFGELTFGGVVGLAGMAMSLPAVVAGRITVVLTVF